MQKSPDLKNRGFRCQRGRFVKKAMTVKALTEGTIIFSRSNSDEMLFQDIPDGPRTREHLCKISFHSLP